MRKFILIAALVLVSAAAQARGTRSLTLASSNESAKVEQSKAAEAPNLSQRRGRRSDSRAGKGCSRAVKGCSGQSPSPRRNTPWPSRAKS